MKKTTEAERQQLVAEWRCSGQFKRTWCREKGIPYTTFVTWINRMPEQSLIETSEMTQWAEVTPTQIKSTGDGAKTPVWAPKPSKIRIIIGNVEVAVESGFDSELLISVLRAVSRVCC